MRLLAGALVDAQLEDARRLGRGLRRQLDPAGRSGTPGAARFPGARRPGRRRSRRAYGAAAAWYSVSLASVSSSARNGAAESRTASARRGSAAAGRRWARRRRPGRRRRGSGPARAPWRSTRSCAAAGRSAACSAPDVAGSARPARASPIRRLAAHRAGKRTGCGKAGHEGRGKRGRQEVTTVHGGKLIASAAAFVRGASGTARAPPSDSIERCGSSRCSSRSFTSLPVGARLGTGAAPRPGGRRALRRAHGGPPRRPDQRAARRATAGAAGHLGGVDLPRSARPRRPSSARRCARSAAASRRGRRAADRGPTWRCAIARPRRGRSADRGSAARSRRTAASTRSWCCAGTSSAARSAC